MQRRFLLLMAVCALATALPPDKWSEETEDTTVNNVSQTTTVNNESGSETKPKSNVITVNTVADMSKKISEAGDKLVILFIMSTKCGLSQRIAPDVEDIADTMDNVVFLKVPVNVNGVEVARIQREYPEYFDFEGRSTIQLPVFGFLKNGIKLEHYENGSNVKKLRDTIAKYTAKHLQVEVMSSGGGLIQTIDYFIGFIHFIAMVQDSWY